MALRSFGPQTLTGSPQPLIGDVTTAAVLAGDSSACVYITVASNTLYQAGDRIVLEPRTANEDSYLVQSKRTSTGAASTTVLECTTEGAVTRAHASGVILQVAIAAIDVVVTPVPGIANDVVIGQDNTITLTTGPICIRLQQTAAGTEGNSWHMAGGTDHNIVNTAEGWMIGAAGTVDVYALVQ